MIFPLFYLLRGKCYANESSRKFQQILNEYDYFSKFIQHIPVTLLNTKFAGCVQKSATSKSTIS